MEEKRVKLEQLDEKTRGILFKEAYERFMESTKAGTLHSDSENPWSPGYRDLPDLFKKS